MPEFKNIRAQAEAIARGLKHKLISAVEMEFPFLADLETLAAGGEWNQMIMEDLVRKYCDAYNRVDVEGLLSLMHNEASYFDAFWNETCSRNNLPNYWQMYFDEGMPYVSRLLDIINVNETQVVTHYEVYEKGDSGIGRTLYRGVEFFTFKDGLVFSVSDHYCDPDPEVLKRLSTYNSQSLHKPKYAKSGLNAEKVGQYKTRLLILMDDDKLYTNRGLSLGMLAKKVGCSTNDLSQIINVEFGLNFNGFLNGYRVKHAKELLLTGTDEQSETIEQVAQMAGFASLSAFYKIFKESFNESPSRFRALNQIDRAPSHSE